MAYLAVLLAICILSHESRNTIGIDNRVRRIAERQRRPTARLRVVLRLKLGKALGVIQVVGERDIGRQVRARVQCAAALAAVESGHEGVLVDPVGAGGRAREAGGDAVAGAVDAVFGVEVDFRHDARHVNALVVADAAGFVVWHEEVGEFLGGDFVLADGALISLGGVLEDVVGVVHVVVVDLVLVVIADGDGAGEGRGGEKDGAEESGSGEMHFDYLLKVWLGFGKIVALLKSK